MPRLSPAIFIDVMDLKGCIPGAVRRVWLAAKRIVKQQFLDSGDLVSVLPYSAQRLGDRGRKVPD